MFQSQMSFHTTLIFASKIANLYDGVDRAIPYTIVDKFKAQFYELYSINRQELVMERFFDSGNEVMKVVLELIKGQKYSPDIEELFQMEAARELSRVSIQIKHSGISVDTLRKQVENDLSGKSVKKIKLYLIGYTPYEIPTSGKDPFNRFKITSFGTPSYFSNKYNFDQIEIM